MAYRQAVDGGGTGDPRRGGADPRRDDGSKPGVVGGGKLVRGGFDRDGEGVSA